MDLELVEDHGTHLRVRESDERAQVVQVLSDVSEQVHAVNVIVFEHRADALASW